ncbi:MAG TPA: methane monooxygenase/ammonia monooxygenase subunit A [Gammaproteobacteria bacterium]|nr:methane monooxygenase/ammonia monooxygenase subunit A [Gammaproteobacteria bacterium]HIM04700.1 methane monooxygenase/ammonia monooxygenase subunit A [Gammaproteobacteria bacterium]
MNTDISRELNKYYLRLDAVVIFVLFSFLGLSVMLHFSLTAGDWDYWIDWRDRRWWPLVAPVSLLMLMGAFTYTTWTRFRLPVIGTTITFMLALFSWLSRYYNFVEFANFPFSFTFPSTYIGLGILLDATLLMTRSLLLTSVFGAYMVGMLVYPLNWPIIAAYKVPVEYAGTLHSVADLMGFQYIRTTTPEYVRIIEESTLRTFGGTVTPLTAVFAGFVGSLVFGIFLLLGLAIDRASVFVRRLV